MLRTITAATTSPRTPCTVTNRLLGLFWANITYHVEHHSYPRVPFYRLPRLHALLHSRPDMPYLLSPYTMYGVASGMEMVGLMRARGREAIAKRVTTEWAKESPDGPQPGA